MANVKPTLSVACGAVLANAARHADAIGDAEPSGPTPPRSSNDGGGDTGEGWATLRYAVTTVLHNAQRLSCRGGSSSSSGGGGAFASPAVASSGGGGAVGGTVQQEPLPVLAVGTYYKWRPEQVQTLVRYVSSLPVGDMSILAAANALGYELWLADRKAQGRFHQKLIQVRRRLDHGRDPLAGRTPADAVPRGTYNFTVWLHRVFRTLPNMTGALSDVAAMLEADPDIAPRLNRRLNPSCRNTPMWRQQVSWVLIKKPEFVKTGQFVPSVGRGGRQAVYRFDEEVARLQLQRCPRTARKHGVPGLPLLGKDK